MTAVLEDSTRKRKTSKAAGQLMRARGFVTHVCYLLGLAPHRDSFPSPSEGRGEDELVSGAWSVPVSVLDCTLV